MTSRAWRFRVTPGRTRFSRKTILWSGTTARHGPIPGTEVGHYYNNSFFYFVHSSAIVNGSALTFNCVISMEHQWKSCRFGRVTSSRPITIARRVEQCLCGCWCQIPPIISIIIIMEFFSIELWLQDVTHFSIDWMENREHCWKRTWLSRHFVCKRFWGFFYLILSSTRWLDGPTLCHYAV